MASLLVDSEKALRMSTAPLGAFADAEEQFADDNRVLLVAGVRELEGGEGGDDFVVGDALRARALVTDFSRAEGDRLLIGDLLAGFEEGTDDLVDFPRLTGKGGTTVVAVDVDGPGRGKAVPVAIVQGDLGTGLAALVSEGVIDLARGGRLRARSRACRSAGRRGAPRARRRPPRTGSGGR